MRGVPKYRVFVYIGRTFFPTLAWQRKSEWRGTGLDIRGAVLLRRLALEKGKYDRQLSILVGAQTKLQWGGAPGIR